MKYKKLYLIAVTLFCFGLTNLQAQTLKDIDGNIYRTVAIGNQVWMAENLKTTKYSDNSNIPDASGNNTWSSLSTPGYCWYDNNAASYKGPFGALYNWYTVKTAKLCPSGWHVPTDSEWSNLTTFLGGENVAGKKLKEAGAGLLWISLNPETSNSSGFTARPGGARDSDGSFHSLAGYCGFWSSTENNKDEAIARDLQNDLNEVGSGGVDKKTGFSVRCIKDN
jgi:uncharacterized protein (TIGR02145 family)